MRIIKCDHCGECIFEEVGSHPSTGYKYAITVVQTDGFQSKQQIEFIDCCPKCWEGLSKYLEKFKRGPK